MTVGFAAAVDGSGIVRLKPLSFPPAWLSITLVLDGWWFRGSGRPILVVCNDVGWWVVEIVHELLPASLSCNSIHVNNTLGFVNSEL